VSAGLQGGADFVHRARLFPLPTLDAVVRPPCASARNRRRFRVQLAIAAVTNRCICTLNQLYNTSPMYSNPPAPFVSFRRQPDNSLSFLRFAAPSAGQLRLQRHLRDRCAAFVLKARAWCHPGPACDISASALMDLLSSSAPEARPAEHVSLERPLPLDSYSAALHLPSSSSFSSAATSVVPLVARRVALPDSLNIVPLSRVLPPDVAAAYTSGPSAALLRSPAEVFTLDFTQPLRRPRIAGSRAEYVKLVARLARAGMVGFTAAPKAVNGVFAVGKDADADRLIIDAQPANRLFVDSPRVSLPDPSHLVQLQVPKGHTMYVGKSDLSNFYHHLGLPEWMQPYFALPPLTPAELADCGLPLGAAYPMCLTLPMGFSHAVYLAQCAHTHVLYSRSALDPSDSLLLLSSPAVTHARAIHGIVIDDFFLFSLSLPLAERVFDAVLAAYRFAGFIVKQSKVVRPTSAPVKVIGFDIDGSRASISLPAETQLSLLRATHAALRLDTVSGTVLSHLIGRWTWVMLLRRPSLAVLQHAYRYISVARGRPFTLWPSVRRELRMLLGLMPLMHAQLDALPFHRAIASDASELAGGVVSTPLTPSVHSGFWPLCSTRHHAVLQARLNADSMRGALAELPPASDGASDRLSAIARTFDAFYSRVSDAPWRTIASKAWLGPEHINALELRAALIAVHWALSYPSALCSRVYLLLDSAVAFFSLWKGRSSSPSLLLVLRKISALLLAGGLSLLPGWVPSAVNPADAPSRLLDRPPGSLAA